MRRLILIFALCSISFFGNAKNKTPFLIGLSPNLSLEKTGESTEVDFNFVPLFAQFSINKYYDIRISSSAMYHFGENDRWDNIGGEVAFPIYYKRKYSAYAASKGFYGAPFASIYNNSPKHYLVANAGFEPGYLFLINNKFAISAGIQIGVSYYAYELQTNKIQSHFAFKLSFGLWM